MAIKRVLLSLTPVLLPLVLSAASIGIMQEAGQSTDDIQSDITGSEDVSQEPDTSDVTQYYLYIETLDGITSRFLIDESLTYRIEGNGFMVESSSAEIRFIIDQIKSLVYKEKMPDISVGNMRVNLPEPKVSLLPHSIKITFEDGTSHPEPLMACITDLSGRTIHSESFRNEVELALDTLSSGVYLLNVSNLPTIKFIVK